jgi:hypothetical protein
MARHATLEHPPLLGECFGLTANVCPLDREIPYRTRFFGGLQHTQRGQHNAARDERARQSDDPSAREETMHAEL